MILPLHSFYKNFRNEAVNTIAVKIWFIMIYYLNKNALKYYNSKVKRYKYVKFKSKIHKVIIKHTIIIIIIIPDVLYVVKCSHNTRPHLYAREYLHLRIHSLFLIFNPHYLINLWVIAENKTFKILGLMSVC